MELTAELAPLGYAHRETEFVLIPGTTTRLYGACGPTALASCASAALQKLVTTEQIYALMRGRGLCDASGVTNDVKLAAAAVIASDQGGFDLTIAEHHSYSGDVWHGWQTFLGWHLGSCDHPTLIELAHGQQLKDTISGLGENASGLTYHFIMLLKRHGGGYSAYAGRTLPSGYWACDGDSYAGGNSRANGFHAADVLQFYSDTTLTAAMPCAGIAFKRAAVAPTTPPTGTTGTTGGGVTSMWTRTSTGARDDQGHEVGQGVADAIFAHGWQSSDGLTSEHYYSQHASVTALADGHTLVWTGAAIQVDLAAEAVAAFVNQTSNLQQQLDAANKEIAALKATPPPAPAPVDPKITAKASALDALMALYGV